MSTKINKSLNQNGTQDTANTVLTFADNKIIKMKIRSRARLEDGTIEEHLKSEDGVFQLEQPQVANMFAEPETVTNINGEEVVIDEAMIYGWFGKKFDKVYTGGYPMPEPEPIEEPLSEEID